MVVSVTAAALFAEAPRSPRTSDRLSVVVSSLTMAALHRIADTTGATIHEVAANILDHATTKGMTK